MIMMNVVRRLIWDLGIPNEQSVEVADPIIEETQKRFAETRTVARSGVVNTLTVHRIERADNYNGCRLFLCYPCPF